MKTDGFSMKVIKLELQEFSCAKIPFKALGGVLQALVFTVLAQKKVTQVVDYFVRSEAPQNLDPPSR